jgi:predicted dehydrogenase
MRLSAGPDVELDGELGTIAVSLIDGTDPVRIFTDEQGWYDEPVEHARAAGPDHLLGVAHLLDCVEQRRSPVASLAHARHVVDIRAAAAVSARTGRFVDVESAF